jgi:hypothetical protein
VAIVEVIQEETCLVFVDSVLLYLLTRISLARSLAGHLVVNVAVYRSYVSSRLAVSSFDVVHDRL